MSADNLMIASDYEDVKDEIILIQNCGGFVAHETSSNAGKECRTTKRLEIHLPVVGPAVVEPEKKIQ